MSPDGQWVAFYVGGLLKKVGIDGATSATKVAEVIEAYGAHVIKKRRVARATSKKSTTRSKISARTTETRSSISSR
jgi:hypothetical protein